MKNIIKRVKQLNRLRFLYLAMSFTMALFILILALQLNLYKTGIEYQDLKYNVLEERISIIYLLKYERFSEYLPPKVKEYIRGNWYISSYYTPVKGQDTYYNGSYEADYVMNCLGDCFVTANGTRLTEAHTFQVVACDNNIYKLGTKFEITLPSDHPEHPSKSWVVTCIDTGGAVKGNHLDLWYGRGWKDQVHPWIGQFSTKRAKVKVLTN